MAKQRKNMKTTLYEYEKLPSKKEKPIGIVEVEKKSFFSRILNKLSAKSKNKGPKQV